MPDLQNLLDQIDRLDKDVTPGPWAVDKDNPRGIHDPLVVYPEDDGGVIAYVQPDHDDAEFIALARTALPQLAKALRAVLEKSEIAHDVLRDRVVKPTEHDVGRSDMADDIQKAITDAMEDQ